MMRPPTQAQYKASGLKVKNPSKLSNKFKFILPPYKKWTDDKLVEGIHYFTTLRDLQIAYPDIALFNAIVENVIVEEETVKETLVNAIVENVIVEEETVKERISSLSLVKAMMSAKVSKNKDYL